MPQAALGVAVAIRAVPEHVKVEQFERFRAGQRARCAYLSVPARCGHGVPAPEITGRCWCGCSAQGLQTENIPCWPNDS